MAVNLIEKLLIEAVETGGTYAEFLVSNDNVAFICDGGSRKSTRNYRRSKQDIRADEKVLKQISDKSLLFSGQLKKIDYLLSDGRTGVFQRIDDGKKCRITARRANEAKEKAFRYVRFVSSNSECTGIAFALKQGKTGKDEISPCTGAIMDGPNTADLSTDLQFVFSGKFKIKNSELDKKYDRENQAVIDELSLVMENAVKEMLHLNLLGMSLFSVLPNTMDDETETNKALIKAVKNVCNTYPVFRGRNGNTVSKINIAYGTDEVTKLFVQELAEPVLNGRYWIEPCTAGSREEYFLIDVGVSYYDRERFIEELFVEENFDACSEILARQGDKWLREFYIFCSGSIVDAATNRQMITALKNIRSIRDSKGKMKYPYEVSLAVNDGSVNKKSIIIKPGIISPSGNDDKYTDQLKRFFMTDLGVNEYSEKPEMKELAESMMNKKQSIDFIYAEKLLTLAQFETKHPGVIDFSSYAIFPCESARGIRRVKADSLVIGKPFVREGRLLAAATGRNTLWSGLNKLLPEKSLLKVLEFAEMNGAIGKPRIIRQKAEKHQDYSQVLFIAGKHGARDTNFDYIIPGLEEILKRRSLQLNKLIWNAIINAENAEESLIAEYSTDNRKVVNRCESSLIRILKERTWVPGNDGKFYQPENITVADISQDLKFDKKNAILKALNFGSGNKRRENELKRLEKLAAKEGLRLVPEKEYMDFIKWKESSFNKY